MCFRERLQKMSNYDGRWVIWEVVITNACIAWSQIDDELISLLFSEYTEYEINRILTNLKDPLYQR